MVNAAVMNDPFKVVDNFVETWQGQKRLSFNGAVSRLMQRVIHTKLGEGRRVAIPSEMCHELGLEPGTPVVLESTETTIVLRPLGEVVREVQEYFADAGPKKMLLSKELSRDRRAEAARDKRG
jgi:bifunctional DNA-binding transcriptional regulator/antitoxin component of YhaV-PrlF toxin-antitoxin module